MSPLRHLFFWSGLLLIAVGTYLIYEPLCPLTIGFLLWAQANGLFISSRTTDDG